MVKEFDFDELDRAVNSLISPTTAKPDSPAPTNPSVDENTTPAINPNSTSDPSSAPVPNSPTPTPVTPVTNNSIVEKRQSGRFMDVVHPSSDMKTATNSTPAPRSRDEIKVAPRGGEPATPVASPATDNVWPDPIDYSTSKEPAKPAESSSPAEATKPEVESQITPELTVDESLNAASSNSPFLPDAKVEKRPLGAFSSEHSNETPKPAEAPTTDNKPANDTPTTPEDKKPVDDQPLGPVGHDEVDTPLPAELQDNVLSIEADSTTPATLDTSTRDEEPVGPTSITQQYTATPSTNKEKPGEIYDTKAYHKALKTPPKKKSSWWLVVWIVLLLVVGAGAGAAIYYFVLPAL